jgi:UDP-N-acetylglucosamine 2-epimerase (hydrolysing)
MTKKNILFITGTRADYGKIKSLIFGLNSIENFEVFIYVSGMHLSKILGSTYLEITREISRNVFIDFTQNNQQSMANNLGDLISKLNNYVNNNFFDMIVVHGDRIDALGGAIVGALNNIKVSHIEGGELSGTIDDSIRHAITKFSHFHFVANQEAKKRLIQLGETDNSIFIIGSPDVDIMKLDNLPSISEVQSHYKIHFKSYAIVIFHPVTTEISDINNQLKVLFDSLRLTEENYIVIYPNNDSGSDIILNHYNTIKNLPKFQFFPSLRFEYFLTLLRNANFIIGNSSAGVREAAIYGIPSIDIGTRQNGRFKQGNTSNIQHVDFDVNQILIAIKNFRSFRKTSTVFGDGKSSERFIQFLLNEEVWISQIQKKFIDVDF